ncbi:MAG: hypothetical protein L6R39_006335, partial [Caloplaca ligustica]
MDSSNLANPMSISEVAGLGPNFAASITAEINSRLDGAFASAGVPTTVPVTEAPVIKTASSGGNLVPGNTVLAAAPKTVEGAAAEAEPTSATAATSAAAEVGPGSSHTEKEPAVSTSQS